MKRIVTATVVLFIMATGGAAGAAERVTDARIAALFGKHSVDGTLLLYNPETDRYYSNDFHRAEKPFIPASTFKIPHAIIALETGAVADSSEVIKWDGVKRGWDKWDRDHTLASALTWSAVWAFQVIARRIGPERMAMWVDKLGYGNRDISGNIDSFWLDGGLRITALEQIDFLRRLRAGTLAASAEAQAEVRRILVIEHTDNFVLRAKTGWAQEVDPNIGWYVGWIEAGQQVMFFALNIDMPEPEVDRHARIRITWKALEQFGFEILP